MRKIDYIIIAVCLCAAILCGINNPLSMPCFIISSSIGLFDSVKNKAKSGTYINSIFLLLNAYNLIKFIF